MKNLMELYKGFLWGVGFSLAAGLIFSVLVSRFAASIEYGYKNRLQELSSKQLTLLADSLGLEIVKTSIESKKIIFATKHINLNDSSFIHTTYNISLSLFNKSGEFISKCESEFPDEKSTEKDIYTVIECPIIFGEANEFDHAKIAITRQQRT
ncbi:hypothetical protein [Rheinheimera sp. 4Y26]|uniref:hypothetical protein n=1 Tax=Rheinheimera sp. 4Y26 TaxID=2977811 RepID=UPI0021B0D84B|nr:hypothetical protein [Rheinheimera sp. 4Y26]MCT6698396.1 hypothetical protein [Rheinheimera sp. 4Y26]